MCENGIGESVANESSRRIAKAVSILATNAPAQNWKRGLEELPNFNFGALGIVGITFDESGPTVVEWNHHRYTRRSGTGKFGRAVWYSRAIGRQRENSDEIGYERLISFKDYSEAEPLP